MTVSHVPLADDAFDAFSEAAAEEEESRDASGARAWGGVRIILGAKEQRQVARPARRANHFPTAEISNFRAKTPPPRWFASATWCDGVPGWLRPWPS